MGHTSAPSMWEWRQEVHFKAHVGYIKLVLQKHKTNKEVMKDLCPVREHLLHVICSSTHGKSFRYLEIKQ